MKLHRYIEIEKAHRKYHNFQFHKLEKEGQELLQGVEILINVTQH